MTHDVAIHEAPIWRDRANFIIVASIAEPNLPKAWEQLWARQIGENQFELCCIPFFCYDLALADIVETGTMHGKPYVVQRVVRSSCRTTFRVWFKEAKNVTARKEVLQKLEELALLFEWSSANLLAIDAPDASLAQQIADYLQVLENKDQLVYETGQGSEASRRDDQ